MALDYAQIVSDSEIFFQSELFRQVQLSGLFNDSKTFADARPYQSYAEAIASYKAEAQQADFDLAVFVVTHFQLPEEVELELLQTPETTRDYIQALWPKLQKQGDRAECSSLLPLPHPYLVPGGRFREIYYWDSYFTALGLKLSGQTESIANMLRNFMQMQQQLGLIPNGNRSYYASRSQPPILALMTELLFGEQLQNISDFTPAFFQLCLEGLQAEHAFWMSGQEQLSPVNTTNKRLVRMPDASLLNRYWDPCTQPRPESFREDIEAAQTLPEEQRASYYQNIRAACESGWDFSSRWLTDTETLTSIRTTQIVPVDLNSLLYKLELTLALYFEYKGDMQKHLHYSQLACQRRAAIQHYLWNEIEGLYFDYDMQKSQQSEIKSLACTLPLFTRIAEHEQGIRVCQHLMSDFLAQGGLLTTQTQSPQQWDAPNGWAPLHWFAVIGMKNYSQEEQAREIMRRWLNTVENYYYSQSTMMEKYNLQSPEQQAQGGEYQVQHGFGWTNGVTLAFYHLSGDEGEGER